MKLALLALTLLAGSAPVAAQTADRAGGATAPSSMGRWGEFRDRQEAMRRQDDRRDAGRRSALSDTPATPFVPQQQVINAFAQCAWSQAPDRVNAALGTEIDTNAERDALRSIARMHRCGDRQFTTGRSGEFRGGLAEAAIHSDAARKGRIEALAPTAPVRVAAGTGRAFVARYAQCVAAADPSGSLGLLSTSVGSPAESDAIRAIPGAMTGCMPEGAAYRVDVRDVRNHIADALFRMSGVAGA